MGFMGILMGLHPAAAHGGLVSDLGVFYHAYRDRQFIKALGAFDRLLAPDNDLGDRETARLLVARGLVRERLADWDKAKTDYDRAVALDPGQAWGLAGRGNVLMANGDFPGAIREYGRALALDPASAAFLYKRGNPLFLLGRYAEAARDYQAALDSQAGHRYARLMLGFARTRAEGSVSGSSHPADLQSASWPDPVFSFLNNGLSEERLLALADDPNPIRRRENRSEAFFYLGLIRSVQGDVLRARDDFRNCLKENVVYFMEYQGARVELSRLGSGSEKPVARGTAP
jgi:lipoprotein NlpI